MSAGVILIKSFVADYCSNSNRRQEKTVPETVFLFSLTFSKIYKEYPR